VQTNRFHAGNRAQGGVAQDERTGSAGHRAMMSGVGESAVNTPAGY
jgi:hypothetical protein